MLPTGPWRGEVALQADVLSSRLPVGLFAKFCTIADIHKSDLAALVELRQRCRNDSVSVLEAQLLHFRLVFRTLSLSDIISLQREWASSGSHSG